LLSLNDASEYAESPSLVPVRGDSAIVVLYGPLALESEPRLLQQIPGRVCLTDLGLAVPAFHLCLSYSAFSASWAPAIVLVIISPPSLCHTHVAETMRVGRIRVLEPCSLKTVELQETQVADSLGEDSLVTDITLGTPLRVNETCNSNACLARVHIGLIYTLPRVDWKTLRGGAWGSNGIM
jgi:hypothetical protein